MEWQSSAITVLKTERQTSATFFLRVATSCFFYHLLLPNRAYTFYNASMSFATTLHSSLI